MVFAGCGSGGDSPLGGAGRPVTMYFVPSAEAGRVLTSGQQIAESITGRTGLRIKTAVPTSYAAVIEAMGAGKADIAWLPTFAYVLAHKTHCVIAVLTTVRHGNTSYRGQILVRSDSGIRSLSELSGKSIAFTDAASTAGHIYPRALFAGENVDIGRQLFAGGHPQAVLAVYENLVDAACTYWSPSLPDGSIGDARRTVIESFPDVVQQVIPIAFTDWIPNDTVSFRSGFPDSLRTMVTAALVEFSETVEGRKILEELYGITGLVPAEQDRYDGVLRQLSLAGASLENLVD